MKTPAPFLLTSTLLLGSFACLDGDAHRDDSPEIESRPVTVFLNFEGGTYSPLAGTEDLPDPRNNLTNVVHSRTELGPWAGSERDAVASCVEQRFADFDVRVESKEPAHAEYIEAVITSDELSDLIPAENTAIAPILTDCRPLYDNVLFVRGHEDAVNQACNAITRTISLSLGLEYLYSDDSVMSENLEATGGFIDDQLPCGHHSAEPCRCGGEMQNSYEELLDRVGPSAN